MSVTKPDISAPGVDYLIKHAMYAFLPGKAYIIVRNIEPEPDYQARGRSGELAVTFSYLQRPQLREMLVAASS
jgi:hypothetical protein